jgi:hypothetical protein
MTIGTKLASKLSVQTFGWDKETIMTAVMADKEKPVFLMRVLGSANGLKPYKGKQQPDGKMSPDGFGFLGNFRCIGPDNDTVNGAQLYLPKYIESMMGAALSDEDTSAVEFAFDVYAEYNAKAATLYQFTVNDLTGKAQSALDEMQESLKELPMPNSGGVKAITDAKTKA